MKCTIPDISIKTFGKAIQSLAKIGEELSFEPTLEGLLLKAVNSTRTCMSMYEFKPRFFQHYDDGSPRSIDQNSSPRYRVASKSCLNIFRSLNNMDKLVDYCQINANDAQCRVVFSIHCKHGIVKTYNLTYMEAEPLKCMMSISTCANVMKADSKLYLDIISNFPSNLEELTFFAKPESLCVRNYVDSDSVNPMITYNTTMTLERDEFESYDVSSEISISFCLKEMKAALIFGEYAGTSSALHFDKPGRPMFVIMDDDPTYAANFIVSTISEILSQSSSSSISINDTSSTCNQPHRTVASNTDTSDSGGYESHHTKPALSNGRRCIGRIEKAKQIPTQRQMPNSLPDDTRKLTNHKLSVTQDDSTSIHKNISTVDIKPKGHLLMNDTSISLLPTNNTLSRCKSAESVADDDDDDVDNLLRQIDEKTEAVATATYSVKLANSSSKVRSLFFGKKPAVKPAQQISHTQKYLDEVLAEDSEDD